MLFAGAALLHERTVIGDKEVREAAAVEVVIESRPITKLASAIPGFSETEVGLEMAGLTREQIIRFQAERRTSIISSLVERIAASRGGAEEVPSGDAGDGDSVAPDDGGGAAG